MRLLASYVAAWAILSAILIAPPILGWIDYRVWGPTVIALFAISASRDRSNYDSPSRS